MVIGREQIREDQRRGRREGWRWGVEICWRERDASARPKRKFDNDPEAVNSLVLLDFFLRFPFCFVYLPPLPSILFSRPDSFWFNQVCLFHRGFALWDVRTVYKTQWKSPLYRVKSGRKFNTDKPLQADWYTVYYSCRLVVCILSSWCIPAWVVGCMSSVVVGFSWNFQFDSRRIISSYSSFLRLDRDFIFIFVHAVYKLEKENVIFLV